MTKRKEKKKKGEGSSLFGIEEGKEKERGGVEPIWHTGRRSESSLFGIPG